MKIKICGITRPEDARCAVAEGADFLGMVFAKSPRQIDTAKAADIVSKNHGFKSWVGVFVNTRRDLVVKTAGEVGFKWVQLHGDESPEDCQFYRDKGLHVIKAFHVKHGKLPDGMFKYKIDHALLDTHSDTARGGTGEVFDWKVLKGISRKAQLFISGGLNEKNVNDLIDRFQPYALDVSSGVEMAPGIKDHQKIRTFIRIARGLGRA